MQKFEKNDQMAFCFANVAESNFVASDSGKVISMCEARAAREVVQKKLHEKTVIDRIVMVSERLRW